METQKNQRKLSCDNNSKTNKTTRQAIYINQEDEVKGGESARE